MKLSCISLALVALAAIMLQATACSGKQEGSGKSSDTTMTAVAEQYKDIYHGSYDKDKSFIVISKKDLKLTVYAQVNGDTVPVAQFPVCLSLNKGQKEKEGDMRTPESEPGSPF
ncbi:MAG: hypothetical protein IIU17_06125, partial [Muribaculaceae bacterium]|nr:hypothetical protein [Muribaculaceae bacterium]